MALINCHGCGNPVSDNAVACPNCGAPVIERNRRAPRTLLIYLGISFISFAIYWIFVWLKLHSMVQNVVAPLQGSIN
jgi:predicted nucleic acid-binding Zn ribbon protein